MNIPIWFQRMQEGWGCSAIAKEENAIRYDLICGDLNSLPEQVNRLLEGGWELLGGPTYAGEDEQRVVFFVQAMIKSQVDNRL